MSLLIGVFSLARKSHAIKDVWKHCRKRDGGEGFCGGLQISEKVRISSALQAKGPRGLGKHSQGLQKMDHLLIQLVFIEQLV